MASVTTPVATVEKGEIVEANKIDLNVKKPIEKLEDFLDLLDADGEILLPSYIDELTSKPIDQLENTLETIDKSEDITLSEKVEEIVNNVTVKELQTEILEIEGTSLKSLD